MENDGIYAEPIAVANLEDCHFYHTVDLPEHETIHGSWDLRGNLDAYLGFVDFKDKRVFDAGTASGLLAFEAEKRGASEVVAFDLAKTEEWDHSPYSDKQLLKMCNRTLQEIIDERIRHIIKVHNSFWFCRKALQSNVRMLYGNIYNIPKEIGPVDISIFGSILLHLRNPLNALEQAAKITRETIIVTDVCWSDMNNDLPICKLIPTPDAPFVFDWWKLTPALISQFLNVLGYTEIKINFHTQKYDALIQQEQKFFTVVGKKESN